MFDAGLWILYPGYLNYILIFYLFLKIKDKIFDMYKYKVWRTGLTDAGFIIKEGETAIVPVMLFNAKLSQDVAKDLYAEGIYAVGFFFSVVPKGQARISTQLSAAHERHHLEKALASFIKVGTKYDIPGKTKQEIIDKYGM